MVGDWPHQKFEQKRTPNPRLMFLGTTAHVAQDAVEGSSTAGRETSQSLLKPGHLRNTPNV